MTSPGFRALFNRFMKNICGYFYMKKYRARAHINMNNCYSIFFYKAYNVQLRLCQRGVDCKDL